MGGQGGGVQGLRGCHADGVQLVSRSSEYFGIVMRWNSSAPVEWRKRFLLTVDGGGEQDTLYSIPGISKKHFVSVSSSSAAGCSTSCTYSSDIFIIILSRKIPT